MKTTICSIVLLFYCFSLKAQAVESEANYYAFGTSFKFGKENVAAFYYGESPEDKLKAFAAFPVFKITKGMHFMSGYMHTSIELPDGSNITENHFLPSVIFTMPITKKLVFTDRFMYFHRLILDYEDKHVFRNRVGFSYFSKLFNKEARVFVHDAVFIDIDDPQLLKNRLIFGGNIALTKWLEPEIWYVFENSKFFDTRHIFYLILTVPLQRYGIFSKKKQKAQSLRDELRFESDIHGF